ncbi:MAG TPA: GldG family protein [Gammaproteobacteria bacterium]
MEMNPRTRWYLRIQNIVFTVLLLALLGSVAWLGERYNLAFDWTANQRNSLTEDSVLLLQSLDAPVEIVAFASETPLLREAIRNLVGRYQRVKGDVRLQFVNPDLAPERARTAGVRFDGTLVIRYKGRTEQVSGAGEREISQALARLARGNRTRVVFMTGHGGRAHDGAANFDLGTLGAALAGLGFELQGLNLATTPLPDDTGILVVAGPSTGWLPAEISRVNAYLDAGGNLLWLTDPEGVAPLPELAARLGVAIKPGTVVDATTQLLGVADPTVAIVTGYPATGPTAGFSLMTLFPRAAALSVNENSGWKAIPMLRTLNNSWRETGELAGNVTPGEGDEMGPLVIGYALERPHGEGAQRAIVIGDGDFASNAFIANQGNLDLAVNIFNWLSAEDDLLNIRVKAAPDVTLSLGGMTEIVIALGFLLVLPLALLAGGAWVFLRRRRR